MTFAAAPAGALPAPDFATELLDGTRVRARDLWDERPLVLVFTASWCEACADVHRAAARAVDAEDGAVALLGLVPTDDAEAARDYAEELDLGTPLGTAGDAVWLEYAAREPPLVALVAPGGKIVRGWPGGVAEDVLGRELRRLVRR